MSIAGDSEFEYKTKMRVITSSRFMESGRSADECHEESISRSRPVAEMLYATLLDSLYLPFLFLPDVGCRYSITITTGFYIILYIVCTYVPANFGVINDDDDYRWSVMWAMTQLATETRVFIF